MLETLSILIYQSVKMIKWRQSAGKIYESKYPQRLNVMHRKVKIKSELCSDAKRLTEMINPLERVVTICQHPIWWWNRFHHATSYSSVIHQGRRLIFCLVFLLKIVQH